MDRLFLDANILFSAAYRPDSRLLVLWRIRNVKLYASHYVVGEARINLAQADQRGRLVKLTERLLLVDAAGHLPADVSLPEKDVSVMLAAIQAGATHLLTGDFRHFGRLFGRRINGVLVVPPSAYLAGRRS